MKAIYLAYSFLLITSRAWCADAYPSKPIRLVVPYPPGGVIDTRARELSECLPRWLRQPVVIDNRPGAGGALGTAAAAKASADGYTVLIGASSQIVFEPLLNPTVSYDPERDFIAVTALGRAPFFLVVNSTLGPKSVKEFVWLARSKPGVFTYGSAGIGTSTSTVMELFKRTAQLDLVHVPYKGDAQAFTDLLGGHVQAQFATYTVIADMVRTGRVHALMQTGDKRLAAAPGVPTAAEAGYPEISYYGWAGIFVPAGTPSDVVEKLDSAIGGCIKEPPYQRKLQETGNEPVTGSPAEFAQFVRSERLKWRKRMQDIGLVAR